MQIFTSKNIWTKFFKSHLRLQGSPTQFKQDWGCISCEKLHQKLSTGVTSHLNGHSDVTKMILIPQYSSIYIRSISCLHCVDLIKHFIDGRSMPMSNVTSNKIMNNAINLNPTSTWRLSHAHLNHHLSHESNI